MSDLIIDPNKGLYPEDYLDISKLNIDVKLETVKREGTSIIAIGESNKVVGKMSSKSVDFLSGNKVDSNDNISSLTTLFTEANNNFDIIGEEGVYRDLETLGITEINVDFNSSNVPVVQISMVDIRGRLFQQGNQSPFAVFFDLPYPIFKLTLKGYLGKSVTYELHLVKFNTSFNSTYGGFEIKCEFIGYNYAFLSDMLIGYLRGIGYTKIGKELLQDSKYEGIHFDDLRQELKDLKETLKEFSITKEQNDVGNLSTIVNKLTEIENTVRRYFTTNFLNKINDSLIYGTNKSFNISDTTIVTTSDNIDSEYKILNEYITSVVKNFNSEFEPYTIKNMEESNNYDMLYSGYVVNSYNNDVLKTVSTDISKNPELNDKIEINLVTLYGEGRHNTKTMSIEPFLSEIRKNINLYQNELNTKRQVATSVFEKFIEHSKLDLGIGYYFRVLCNHADVFMKSIYQVAYNAESDPERKSQFINIENLNHFESEERLKIMPFPEYREYEGDFPTENNYEIQDDGSYLLPELTINSNNDKLVEKWIGNIQAEGKIIPEVEFIEDLLHGMIRAKQDEKEDLALLDAPLGEQIVLFTPIHPIDTLNTDSTYQPYSKLSTVNNIEVFKKYISYRSSMFLSTQNAFEELPDDVLNDFADIEWSNVVTGIGENENLKDLIFNQVSSMQELIIDNNIIKRKINGVDYVFNKLMYKGSYSNSIDINNNSVIDFNHSNSFVVGENHIIDSNNKIFYLGFNSFEEYKKLNSKPINLSITDEEFKPEIVKPHEVLDSSDISYNKTEIKSAKFNSYKGFPYINTFNNKSAVLNFYNTNNDITPNDLLTRSVVFASLDSNETIEITDEAEKLVFGSDLFRFQSNNSSKALVFLLSIPFNLEDQQYKNMGEDILSMFKYRTGSVKTSFLWCAWIGAMIKCSRNELKLKVISNNKDIIPITNNNVVIEGSEGYWKFDRTEIVNGINIKRMVIPYESIDKYGVMNTSINPNYKFAEFSQSWLNMHSDIQEQFISKFDEFLIYFNEYILPYCNIYIPEMNNLTYSTNTFDNVLGTSLEGNSVDGWWLKDKNNNRRKLLYNDFTKKGIFIKNDNIEFKYENFVINFDYFGRHKHSYNAKIKEGSILDKNLNNLFVKYVNITNYNANFWSNLLVDQYDFSIIYSVENNYINGENAMFLNSNLVRLNSIFIEKIKSANSRKRADDIENATKEGSMMMEVFGSENSDDIKLKLYKDVKSIYDKWICGSDRFIGSEYKPLYDSFVFNNRTYEDISEKFKVNLHALVRDLYSNLHQPLIGHISKVLSMNNFNFLPMPNYVNISNRDDLLDMFSPRYYSDSLDDTHPMFMCMYVGEYSSKLDLGDSANFKNDGITMTRVDGSLGQISASDFINKNNVPIIIVRYGDPNQSIFKDFEADQSEYSITNESLVIVDDITKNNGLGQNLFDIYSVRSYKIKIKCLGNAMLQPFMYFYLEGVPMFHGLYLITKVNHRVTPNSMESEITAIRMRSTMTKMVDIASLYHTLFAEVSGTFVKGGTESSKFLSTNYSPIEGFNNNIIHPLENSVGITRQKIIDAKYGLKETIDFMYEFGRRWYNEIEVNKNFDTPSEIFFNDLSHKFGKSVGGHKSHKKGTSVDFRPAIKGKVVQTTTVSSPNYHREATKRMIEIMLEIANEPKWSSMYPNGKVIKAIGFQDKELFSVSPLIKDWSGHANHLHLELNIPTKYLNSDNTIQYSNGVGDKVDKIVDPFTNNVNDYFEHCGQVSNLGYGMDNSKLKALLDVISFAEGTMGRSNNGYDVLFGSVGKKLKVINNYTFNTSITHRGKKNANVNGNGNWSTTHNGNSTGAAGRYQFMYGTWMDTHFALSKIDNTTNNLKRDNMYFNKPLTKYNQDNACAKLVLNILNIKESNSIIINSKNDLIQILKKMTHLQGGWEAFKHIDSKKLLSSNNLYQIYQEALRKY